MKKCWVVIFVTDGRPYAVAHDPFPTKKDAKIWLEYWSERGNRAALPHVIKRVDL